MRLTKRLLSLFLVLMFTLAVLPAAFADTPASVLDPDGDPDYMLRIDGGRVSDHLETVNGKECVRVDLYLDGVTNDRLLSSISFKLAYDPDQLTYVKYKALAGNDVMSIGNPNEAGLFQFAFVSSSGMLISGTTPLLTLWFTVSEVLPDGTQIRFSVSEAIKADSVSAGSYNSQKRSVGTDFAPFLIRSTIFGDANCDGAVTPADAALVLQALIGMKTLSDQGLKNAKVDGTDTLNAEDAALILRYIVKLIARFPVQE